MLDSEILILTDLQGRRHPTLQRKLCGNCGIIRITDIYSRICKEVVIWIRLSHPNVLRFIGVANSPSPFSLVSPWMYLGKITDYTKKNHEVNLLPLVSFCVPGIYLRSWSKFYLHSRDIVQGDLKKVRSFCSYCYIITYCQQANVLIDDDKQASIAGYVLTTIVSDLTSEQIMPS
jgi:serine/threonine protein kinase